MIQAGPEGARQQTLAHPLEVRGQGLHSGQAVRVALRPAAAGTGLRFRRVDLDGAPTIPVTPDSLESGMRCTALQHGGARVRTVEHLLAVCMALQVDNLEILIDAEEVPILDGSAADWLRAFEEAGLCAQEMGCQVVRIRKPVLWSQGDTHLMALPAPELRLTVASVTQHPVAGNQMVDLTVSARTFGEVLAGARTFCYLEEVEALRAAGLARGGSLDNAIVVQPEGYSSPLRMDNELAAHKALDLLGDLAVLGSRLCGHIVAVRPGHGANQQLVRCLWGQYLQYADHSEQNTSERASPDLNGAEDEGSALAGARRASRTRESDEGLSVGAIECDRDVRHQAAPDRRG